MRTFILARATAFVLSLFTFGLGVARGQVTTNTCTNALNSGEYSRFSIIELAEYSQTSASAPVLASTNSFFFEAIADLATNLSVTNATLTLPGAGQEPKPLLSYVVDEFIMFAYSNSFADLISAYPDGSYVFKYSNTTETVSLPAGSTLPNAPTLSNYVAAQNINASQDYTLSWSPFTGAGSSDLIVVDLNSETNGVVFQSETAGCPGALDGTATSILIPANTLSSNQTYRAEIVFIKVFTLSSNTTTHITLLSGMETVTETTVSTGAVAAPSIVLSNATLLAGGGVQFDLTTTPGQFYEIQYNSNLSDPTGWTLVTGADATTTLTTFTIPTTSGGVPGFYRAVLVEF
jgi:hypothetical protein